MVMFMRCEEFKENLLDYVAAPPGETPAHAKECESCSAELASLRQTMSVLDEWHAPKPSAYFDTRLKARLREEAAQSRLGWKERLAAVFHQVRMPVLAAALGAAMLTGVSIYRSSTADGAGSNGTVNQVSAVEDLQTLDNNYNLIQDLDSLDDSAAQVNDTGL
jgi:hypothetical protein